MVDKRKLGHHEKKRRSSKRLERSSSEAIESSDGAQIGDQESSEDVGAYLVNRHDVRPTSNLSLDTLISTGDVVEKMDGDFLRISRISRRNPASTILHGDLYILHHKSYNYLPQTPNEVYWSCQTINGIDEVHHGGNSVELRNVKQLRRLVRISQGSPESGSEPDQLGEHSGSIISDLPTLVCRWKFVTVEKVAGKWTEQYIRALTTSEANMPSTLYSHSLIGHVERDVIPAGKSLKRKRSSEVSSQPPSVASASGVSGSPPPGLYTFGDMYCGAGGMSCGAEQAGLSVAWGVDENQDALSTFRTNFPTAEGYCMSDNDFYNTLLQEQSSRKIDILHLSPPCQAFSTANTTGGRNDAKNRDCVSQISQLLGEIKPRITTLEEVPSLVKVHKQYFEIVLRSYITSGYSVRWKIIDCVEHGVPQWRTRLFMIAARPGESLPPFPTATHGDDLLPYATIAQAINNIPDGDPLHVGTAPNRKPYTQPFYRENVPFPYTVTTKASAAGGGMFHPTVQRSFTLREIACLQGFAMGYQFQGGRDAQRKQIGNAVPSQVAKAILESVMGSLWRTDCLAREKSREDRRRAEDEERREEQERLEESRRTEELEREAGAKRRCSIQ